MRRTQKDAMNTPARNRFTALATLIPVAIFFLAAPVGRSADDKAAEATKAKPKPIKLAAAKISPEVEAAVPGADPGFDADPNLPSYLRPVRLYNRDGRYLDAKLVSVAGDMVTVKRLSDEREFEISIKALDEVSYRRVEMWMNRDPEAIDYSIGITARKRQAETRSFESMGRIMKTSDWVYDVVITNQSRNELKDAEVEYRVVFNDEVEFVKTAVYPGEGDDRQDGQAYELPELTFNGRAEFSTPAIAMHTYEYVPSRGAKEYFRDQVVGIWVRVLRQGKVIAEYQSNPTAMSKLAWDGDKDEEVRIRDSFKEQFQAPGAAN